MFLIGYAYINRYKPANGNTLLYQYLVRISEHLYFSTNTCLVHLLDDENIKMIIKTQVNLSRAYRFCFLQIRDRLGITRNDPRNNPNCSSRRDNDWVSLLLFGWWFLLGNPFSPKSAIDTNLLMVIIHYINICSGFRNICFFLQILVLFICLMMKTLKWLWKLKSIYPGRILFLLYDGGHFYWWMSIVVRS
jgi:hypothetical protein